MYQSITFYNNKGGVSKTTTAFNFAAFLAGKCEKKVLIIDADPQCNITELFYASSEYFDDSSLDLPGSSILDVYRDRLSGASSRVDVDEIVFGRSDVYKNLYIIRGDIEFSSHAESYFGNSIAQAITNNVNEKNTYVSFRRMVRDLVDKHNFDHIIIDVGPSSGAISRLAFLACDGFFVPSTPDRFCYLAVKTLPKIINSWVEHDKLILKTLSPFGIESDFSEPAFLGAISQNFQVHRGNIKKSFKKWQDLISKELKRTFLSKDSMVKYSDDLKKNPFVCSIENVGPLAPVAQQVGKAIFDLGQEDTKMASQSGQKYYGAVFDGWQQKVDAYRTEIKKLVDLVV